MGSKNRCLPASQPVTRRQVQQDDAAKAAASNKQQVEGLEKCGESSLMFRIISCSFHLRKFSGHTL